LGVLAAEAAALMTHYYRYQLGPKNDVGRFLEEHAPGQPWNTPWTGKVGHMGVMSVRAAVTAMIASSGMSDLLTTCIAFTGDVDTVAAIALAAGSVCSEIEQDLPANLHQELERGAFGYDFLIELDVRLAKKFFS
jgi:hypothetical protein